MVIQDSDIIQGLAANDVRRGFFERQLYKKYEYFIKDGCTKHQVSYEDSFSAYSDACLSVIHNIIGGYFHKESTLKTYFYRIFSHKCVDVVRKSTTIKERVHNSFADPDVLTNVYVDKKDLMEGLVNREYMNTVKEQLQTMGEKCREVLLLFEDDYTDKEIAEKMGYVSSAVAKTTRLRCLEKLKEKMQHLLY